MAVSIARQSPRPVRVTQFDAQFDIVVVGCGGIGLAAALFSRWHGNQVVILEKAAEIGGTTRKAAFWYWVPNNKAMQAAGIPDNREDCLRYMARLSHPEHYDPRAPHLGLTPWEYGMCAAIYDNACVATELLADKLALEYRHCAAVPDYWAELPEDKAPTGRILLPKAANESMSNGGEVAIRTMGAAALRDGIEIRTNHRVQRVVMDDAGRVVGVEADTAADGVIRVKARKAVIFASGGFTHDAELRRNFLSAPVFGGCAAHSNEGDFVLIGSAVGAALRNMNYAWMCPIILEKALKHDPTLSGTFSPSGDSMIWVDRSGHRVTNEKLAYNESAQAFFKWDPARSEYPNLVLIAVWDQRSQDHCASDEYGRFIVPPGTDDSHVIKGDSIEALTAAIRDRFERVGPAIGHMSIDPDFGAHLRATIARFNEFARQGKDLDFHRGERQVELLFNGPTAADPVGPNPTMYPISEHGPYYAALMTGGTLDTKGGPMTNSDGQVLDAMGQPIPGLYGAGNCVASPSGRAYWAGGATLGSHLAFAYLAANAAHREPVKVSTRT
ncbi:MAG TPA: FAD-dependent oxidoreductase [Steroidobacteraceae bacterium]|nr:FAD-dependent oxidoreductase [Steroidobacteraceae bacterium]